MKKSPWCSAPNAIQRPLNYSKHPRPGPQNHHAASDHHSRADVRKRANRGPQEFSRARIDLHDVRDHLAAGRDPIAKGQEQ